MDIGFIYSSSDPRQKELREFLRRYVNDRGMLANIIEKEAEVTSPTLIIDGLTLEDKRRQPRDTKAEMYPSLSDIAKTLEERIWCL